jgi:hypothetical protein
MAPRVARPALLWLRAHAAQCLDAIAEAEAYLLASESLDPSWPLTLESLARYASDRGDAERGLALLSRARVPASDQLVSLLEQFRPPQRPGLGRNDPCWCASGRNYKKCHLGREQLPLEHRAEWLYMKALMILGDYDRFAHKVIEAMHARVGYSASPDLLAEAFGHVLVHDAVLFEGGAFASFLKLRGYLLPNDERRLAEQWLTVKRAVNETISVRRGEGLTFRDLRTGDLVDVRERAGSQQLKVGRFYCARVVPAGDSFQIFGGIEPVSSGTQMELSAFLAGEPDPIALVETLSRRRA